ncbi:MAG: type II toxin-antitoxin system HicB family antitoxin [Planctomycetales bacterium]|nr:type II toxin-antitoxin system HicB family antitoxin [Planctomycetales bacterium]MBN8626959.1 type II toxin-antitoxin system HicB family antitoxin [Planctomycetota bacterium]
MKYLVIFEPTSTGFSSYSPDLPGCASTGATREECESNMREAIEFHLEGLALEGMPIPAPVTFAATLDVPQSA